MTAVGQNQLLPHRKIDGRFNSITGHSRLSVPPTLNRKSHAVIPET